MKRITISVFVLVPMLLLSGCFAFVSPGTGSLGINIELPPEAKGPSDRQVAVLVVNAAMEEAIKEVLWLVDKETDGLDLNSTEEDRLEELAIDISNNGLIKYGGDYFWRTEISAGASEGSFGAVPIPADQEYFIKIFVLAPGQEIGALTVDELADVVLDPTIAENQLFNTEDYNPLGGNWTTWTRFAGSPFPITVEPGEIRQVDVDLRSEL